MPQNPATVVIAIGLKPSATAVNFGLRSNTAIGILIYASTKVTNKTSKQTKLFLPLRILESHCVPTKPNKIKTFASLPKEK